MTFKTVNSMASRYAGPRQDWGGFEPQITWINEDGTSGLNDGQANDYDYQTPLMNTGLFRRDMRQRNVFLLVDDPVIVDYVGPDADGETTVAPEPPAVGR